MKNTATYSQIMREYGVRLKKRLGQHFMTDPGLLASVAGAMVPGHDWVAVEIGAGLGTLTRELCARARWVYALEIDRELEPAVLDITADFANLTWIWGDALKHDLSGYTLRQAYPTTPLVLCGNLPYYVTSEIVYSALVARPAWNRLAFVVQDELGRRMVESPGSREFGRLSLWCQYRSKVKVERKIPRGAFLPPPKVDSCLVTMEVYREFPLAAHEEEVLDVISRRAFSQRRKTLLNSLLPLFHSKAQLRELADKCGIDLSKRPEDMSMSEYVTLARAATPHIAQNLR
ncbi:MAG: 16S rRNA (adenine(1518)-N(6)/adenine(1519)-N(6))-dimethyltransferase RsmA [Bacillota bacterium]|jgi:16S rRNA (adenine1518-N6/adenine1519-N6)-dimethyltransferase